jgi:ComF family protein
MPLQSLLNALVPPLCAGCGASAGEAEPLCGVCRRELRWLEAEPVQLGAPPDPFGEARARGRASGGAPAPSTGILAWAPVAYEGPARGLVRGLKFRGATRAAPAMAAQIAANAPAGWLAAPAALVPVPLHPARRRKRGYNQAERLAAALAVRTGLHVHDCLERAGPRGTQVGRDRAQRLAGIPGSVRPEAERAPPPHSAILVDDVITTGATLAACAGVLRAQGSAEVMAVAYARTPGR